MVTFPLGNIACQKRDENQPFIHKREPQLKTDVNYTNKPEYAVGLLPVKPLKTGQPSQVTVHLASKGAYHVNTEYPLSFIPNTTQGLHFNKKRIALLNSMKTTPCANTPQFICEIQAPIPFKAFQNTKLSGVLAFSVCTDEQCLIRKTPLSVEVQVK